MEMKTTMLENIRTLLAASEKDVAAPSLAEIEDTLTAGYAEALQLEAERWRLERRVGEVASRMAGGEAGADETEELASLARRMSETDTDLGVLRRALRDLRDRASALRAA
jgi:hypothetical protein